MTEGPLGGDAGGEPRRTSPSAPFLHSFRSLLFKQTAGRLVLQENAETAEVDKLVRRPASVLSAAPVQTNRRKIGFTYKVTEETEKMSEGEDASLCFLCALLFKNKPSEDWVYKSSGGSRGPAKLDT